MEIFAVIYFQSKANEEHRKLEEEVEKIRTKLDDVKSGKQVEDECINADDYTKNYPAKIPSFLHDFVQRKAPYWARSAINSLKLKDKVHFVKQKQDQLLSGIDTGRCQDPVRMMPVDYENTGQIQQNMQYDNGLQQFVQILQRLAMTSPSVTPAFKNNIQFFKQLQQQGVCLSGYTGTLGSEAERRFLEEQFNVDTCVIEPHVPSKFRRLPDTFCDSEEDWIQKSTKQVKQILFIK